MHNIILYYFKSLLKSGPRNTGGPPVLQGAGINVFVMNDITVRDIDNI